MSALGFLSIALSSQPIAFWAVAACLAAAAGIGVAVIVDFAAHP
jgi:hypothetical protein